LARSIAAAQLAGGAVILPDGKCHTAQFDQCCLPIDLYHRT